MRNHTETEPKGGPLPGLLRPPIVFLSAVLLGVALNRGRPLPFAPPSLTRLGPVVALCAVLLFLLSFREFRKAGTSVRDFEANVQQHSASDPNRSFGNGR